jgi:hypothetical protein
MVKSYISGRWMVSMRKVIEITGEMPEIKTLINKFTQEHEVIHSHIHQIATLSEDFATLRAIKDSSEGLTPFPEERIIWILGGGNRVKLHHTLQSVNFLKREGHWQYNLHNTMNPSDYSLRH